jgi:hypothetical protein
VVKPAAARENGKAATLEEIVCVLESAWSAGKARAFVAAGGGLLRDDGEEAPNGKNQIYIADIQRTPDGRSVTILINRGDPGAVSPAFLNMAGSGSVRVENPKPPEAQGWSAHLTIGMLPSASGSYRACFEKMPGLSSALVLAAIERIVDEELAGNPTYVYEYGRKVGQKMEIARRSYRPVLDVARMPSERLLDDLEKGELSSITLTRASKAYAGPGIANLVTRQERKLILHTAKADAGKLEDLIDDVMSYAKEKKYERVTFHLDKLPGGMSNHPTISVAEEDALEVLYVRAQRLTDFPSFLEQAYETACPQIRGKMEGLVYDDSHWD